MSIQPQRAPVVRAAVNALDAFGALNRDQATQLGELWARRQELSPVDLATVLARYPRPAGPDLPPGDPTGGNSGPGGQPLPPADGGR